VPQWSRGSYTLECIVQHEFFVFFKYKMSLKHNDYLDYSIGNSISSRQVWCTFFSQITMSGLHIVIHSLIFMGLMVFMYIQYIVGQSDAWATHTQRHGKTPQGDGSPPPPALAPPSGKFQRETDCWLTCEAACVWSLGSLIDWSLSWSTYVPTSR
jgi:hypothetical protein